MRQRWHELADPDQESDRAKEVHFVFRLARRSGRGVLLLGFFAGGFIAQEPGAAGSEKVLGIGGLFFRARNPASLARWYERHLGVALTPTSYGQQPWLQEAGPTVFAPFPDTTGYFGARDRAWMVNFRVRDLAAMVAQLRAGGIAVVVDPQLYPNGRFARLHDPEGNPIELGEPVAPGAPE